MKTPAELTAAEIVAGTEAASKAITAHVPRWARAMISDATIVALVTEIVTAVDVVRDNQTTKGNSP